MPVSDYTPGVEDVAAFIRARTKTVGGAEAGTFASDTDTDEQNRTRPTAEQVTSLIGDALSDLTASFGVDITDAPGDDPDAYRTAAKRVAALGTALLVELTYFPEQVATGRSPYSQLLALYNTRLKRVTELINEAAGGTGGGGTEGSVAGGGLPSYGGFPESRIGMEQPL